MSDVIKTLENVAGGTFLGELADQMNECVESSKRTQKMSTLTVSLKFKPEGSQITLLDEIKTVIPKPASSTLFHVTDDNGLSLRDPRQRDHVQESVEQIDEKTAVVEPINRNQKLESV